MPRQDTAQRNGRFPGFSKPSYTMVPDVVFDQLLPLLSGAELKVLLYIIRRTFGFKKAVDGISISQMLNGITKKNGEELDHGCGVKDKKTVLAALKSLAEDNIIITARQSDAKHGNLPTLYALNVVEDPLGEKSRQGEGGKFPHALGGKIPPHNMTDVQQTVKQHHHAATAAHGQSDDVSVISSKQPKSKPITTTQSPPSSKRATKGDDPDPKLVAALVVAGVSQRQAERLVTAHPADRIQAALEFLPFRNAQNPAGYLVREIEDGGWMAPAAVEEHQKKVISAERRKAAEERTAKLEAERARATEDRYRQVERVIESLAPELISELWAEARAQMTKYTRHATTADESNPFLKAAFHNLIQDRYLGRNE